MDVIIVLKISVFNVNPEAFYAEISALLVMQVVFAEVDANKGKLLSGN